MFKFKKTEVSIDEAAAKARLPQEQGPKPGSLDEQASQIKTRDARDLIKTDFVDEAEWKAQKPKAWVEEIAQGDVKVNPANLSKAIVQYQNRIKYPDIKLTVNGEKDVPLGWTQKEIEEMAELEKSDDPKYKDMVKW